MSDSYKIVTSLLQEDLIETKKLIKDALLSKLGKSLEEKLVTFAPTVFGESDLIEGWTNEVPDVETLSAELSAYQNTGSASLKLTSYLNQNSALQDLRANSPQHTPPTQINAGYDPEVAEIIENFEQDLTELVEEIQQDTGEILTEIEIATLAEQYLDSLLSDEEDA